MSIAFVLISTAAGQEYDVYNRLLKVPEIRDLMPLFGEYDLIAKVEGSGLDNLDTLIVNSIRSMPGVTATKTLATAKL